MLTVKSVCVCFSDILIAAGWWVTLLLMIKATLCIIRENWWVNSTCLFQRQHRYLRAATIISKPLPASSEPHPSASLFLVAERTKNDRSGGDLKTVTATPPNINWWIRWHPVIQSHNKLHTQHCLTEQEAQFLACKWKCTFRLTEEKHTWWKNSCLS